MVVGVLALQGDFKEHISSLQGYGVEAIEVRTKNDLSRVDALIIPGGESTTISQLLMTTGLNTAICKRNKEGMMIWGTCAGAILLAQNVISQTPLPCLLALIDIDIERNSFGTHTDSFRGKITLGDVSSDIFFIRAPKILRCGRGVQVLFEWKGNPVLVRNKRVLLSTFHSELSPFDPVLELFLQLLKPQKSKKVKQ